MNHPVHCYPGTVRLKEWARMPDGGLYLEVWCARWQRRAKVTTTFHPSGNDPDSHGREIESTENDAAFVAVDAQGVELLYVPAGGVRNLTRALIAPESVECYALGLVTDGASPRMRREPEPLAPDLAPPGTDADLGDAPPELPPACAPTEESIVPVGADPAVTQAAEDRES